MTEEEIIERRLMIDGDGTGDDRRITQLYKTFVKWCAITNPDESEAVKEQMLDQLELCEFMFSKSIAESKMCVEEKKKYDELSKSYKERVEKAKIEKQELQEKLKEANKIQKFNEECEVLYKAISQFPSRSELTKQVEQLMGEVDVLKKKKQKLDENADTRKKNIFALTGVLQQLKGSLGDDIKVDEDESDSDKSLEDISD